MGIFISSLPPKKGENRKKYLKPRPRKSLKVGMILLGKQMAKVMQSWMQKEEVSSK